VVTDIAVVGVVAEADLVAVEDSAGSVVGVREAEALAAAGSKDEYVE
jgi:hypothetical protein